MSLSLTDSQKFLSKQAQLWQTHGAGLEDTCQDLQGLRDEEAQAVLQLEAEKAIRFLQQQLALWSSAAKGQLVRGIHFFNTSKKAPHLLKSLSLTCVSMDIQIDAELVSMLLPVQDADIGAEDCGNSLPTPEPKNFRER